MKYWFPGGFCLFVCCTVNVTHHCFNSGSRRDDWNSMLWNVYLFCLLSPHTSARTAGHSLFETLFGKPFPHHFQWVVLLFISLTICFFSSLLISSSISYLNTSIHQGFTTPSTILLLLYISPEDLIYSCLNPLLFPKILLFPPAEHHSFVSP